MTKLFSRFKIKSCALSWIIFDTQFNGKKFKIVLLVVRKHLRQKICFLLFSHKARCSSKDLSKKFFLFIVFISFSWIFFNHINSIWYWKIVFEPVYGILNNFLLWISWLSSIRLIYSAMDTMIRSYKVTIANIFVLEKYSILHQFIHTLFSILLFLFVRLNSG